MTGVSCRCGRTSPRLRCIGRTDDMLIYKAMNVFPSAIRDVVTRRFGDAVEPHISIWKERSDQVRFDHPIPVEVELKPGIGPDVATRLVDQIGGAVRDELSVRVAPSLVPAGTLPRSAYKTPLVYARPDGTATEGS